MGSLLLRGAAAGATAAALTLASRRLLRRYPPGGAQRWQRQNYAGRTVSLLGGVSVAAGQVGAPALAGLVATDPRMTCAALATSVVTGAAGLCGAYDDLAEHGITTQRDVRPAKGFAGHLGALARGRVTTGAVKIAGIGAGSVLAALALHAGGPTQRRRAGTLTEVAVSAVVIAGIANLVNLLDLRPGRAAKAVLGLNTGILALQSARGGDGVRRAGVLPGSVLPGSIALAGAATSLPGDLREESMLGDTGANALGASSGVALAAALPLPARTGAALVIVALTLASEKVSFSRVIDRTPLLHALDQVGRLS